MPRSPNRACGPAKLPSPGRRQRPSVAAGRRFGAPMLLLRAAPSRVAAAERAAAGPLLRREHSGLAVQRSIVAACVRCAPAPERQTLGQRGDPSASRLPAHVVRGRRRGKRATMCARDARAVSLFAPSTLRAQCRDVVQEAIGAFTKPYRLRPGALQLSGREGCLVGGVGAERARSQRTPRPRDNRLRAAREQEA